MRQEIDNLSVDRSEGSLSHKDIDQLSENERVTPRILTPKEVLHPHGFSATSHPQPSSRHVTRTQESVGAEEG